MPTKALTVNPVCTGVVALEYNEIEVELKQLENRIHELLKRQSDLEKDVLSILFLNSSSSNNDSTRPRHILIIGDSMVRQLNVFMAS